MVQNASKSIDFVSECYILDSMLHLFRSVYLAHLVER
jgi:CTP:phosphocholine cytidylyltransferase-like protein